MNDSPMTLALPLKFVVFIPDGPQAGTYHWAKPGDPLPKDYYILIRRDGWPTFCLGAQDDLAGQVAHKTVDLLRAYNLGAHTVQILDANGVLVKEQPVIGHWWNARWTFRPSAPLAVSSPADIVARRRMFPFGDTGKRVTAPDPNWKYVDPFDTAGITIGMGRVGERADIGLVTDPGGAYMRYGDPQYLIAWALAGAGCPNHFRDGPNSAVVDLIQFPFANCADKPELQGWPYLPKGVVAADNYQGWGGGWGPQQAHYCEMNYLAYQATKDETFLEDLQCSTIFMCACDAWNSVHEGKTILHGEYRGIAWAFRNLFMAHAATQDAEAARTLPTTCKPSSYFKTLILQSLDFCKRSMTDPTCQVFRIVSGMVYAGNPSVPALATWQQDYLLTTLPLGVLVGITEVIDLYLWALKSVIDRLSGDSDYPPGFGGAYYLDGTQPSWLAAIKAGVPGLGGAEPATADELAKLEADKFNGGVALRNPAYLFQARAALVIAQYLSDNWAAFGLPGQSPRDMYPNIDLCVTNADRMIHNQPEDMYLRASVVRGGNSSPPIIIPPETPPPGEIHMGQPFTVQVGKTVDLPLTWNADGGAPSQAPTHIAVSAVPLGMVELTLAADNSKVTAKGLQVGAPVVQVTGTVPGTSTILSDSTQGTVVAAPLPLPTAIHINP